jgi:RNA polymerase sigma-70 factor (ECF subfamily)
VNPDRAADLLDDRDAVRRMTAGDASGLERLYLRHATVVYSLAIRIVGNPPDAQDVTQEVFSQVWRTASRYDGVRGEVAAWLLIICRTRALDLLRRRKRAGDASGQDEAVHDIPDPAPSVELTAASAEQAARARAAVAALPEEQQTALNLAYYEGLTHVEIAARTATPLGTVKTRIRSALMQLRTAMGAPARGGTS